MHLLFDLLYHKLDDQQLTIISLEVIVGTFSSSSLMQVMGQLLIDSVCCTRLSFNGIYILKKDISTWISISFKYKRYNLIVPSCFIYFWEAQYFSSSRWIMPSSSHEKSLIFAVKKNLNIC